MTTRRSIARKKSTAKKTIFIISSILVLLAILIGLNFSKIETWYEQVRITTIKPKQKLSVPLENQYPKLPNGCEVTALSMLLDYYHLSPGKMVLAQNIDHVSSYTKDNLRGNPHEGFVGYMGQANAGWCVYHEPLFKIAHKYTNRIRDISGSSFNKLLYLVSNGHPVMIITNITFSPVKDLTTWQTTTGPVKITPSSHACVITGYNSQTNTVYVNDPFGTKNKAVNWGKIAASYKQRDSQALYIK